MPKIILVLVLALVPFSEVFAKGKGLLSLEIEPIVGYERVQKLIPVRHTRERFFYGARIIAGVPLVSAEAEVTRATDNEDLPDRNLFMKDDTDRVKLGLRSTIRLIGIVYAFARAGGQAEKNRHTETLAGVTTVTDDPITIKPYVGAGLRARMGRNLRFDADFTVVFHDTVNWNHYDYQTTAGFAVSFP